MAKRRTKRQAAVDGEPISDYERRREDRIRENRAKLEALGLPSLASSLVPNQRTDDVSEKTKRRSGEATGGGEADEEYRPSDEGSSSQSESDGEEERGNRRKGYSTGSGRRSNQKGKTKMTPVEGKARKKLFDEGISQEFNIDEEDYTLAQAIALSLGEPINSGAQDAQISRSCRDAPRNGGYGKVNWLGGGKRKKENIRRVQMTEDEAMAYFFTFDEAGKGLITLQDLQRVALTHDFCWSDKEIIDMIRLFDTDGDGKLNFMDFHKIVARCNMFQNNC